MKTEEMITRIKTFRDFYGQDIIIPDHLKTKEDCRALLWAHHDFLQTQNTDALSHLERFINELEVD